MTEKDTQQGGTAGADADKGKGTDGKTTSQQTDAEASKSGGDKGKNSGADNGDAQGTRVIQMPEDVFQKITKVIEDFPGAVRRLDQKISEVAKGRNDTNRSGQDYTASDYRSGDDDATEELPSEDAAAIRRDFARTSEEYLESQDLSKLSDDQRAEFDAEWALRKQHLEAEALRSGKLVTKKALEQAYTRATRAAGISTSPPGTATQDVEAARRQGQMDAMAREAGNAGSTSSVDRSTAEISEEAKAAAKRSLLVREGRISEEQMAKNIQARMDARSR